MLTNNRLAQLEKNAPKPAAKPAEKSIMQRILDGEDVDESKRKEYARELRQLSDADFKSHCRQLLVLCKDDTSAAKTALEKAVADDN